MDDWTQDPCEMVSLGPMTVEEREELLSLAEELRERNIDPAFWLRTLFTDPPQKSKGRHPAPSDEAERDERLLASYQSALGLLRRIDRGTPPGVATADGIREAARLEAGAFTLRVDGDGFAPFVEAIASYRRGLRGDDALDSRAAMLALGLGNADEAISALRALQARVRRRRTFRATE